MKDEVKGLLAYFGLADVLPLVTRTTLTLSVACRPVIREQLYTDGQAQRQSPLWAWLVVLQPKTREKLSGILECHCFTPH
jgi:hypothetical protein